MDRHEVLPASCDVEMAVAGVRLEDCQGASGAGPGAEFVTLAEQDKDEVAEAVGDIRVALTLSDLTTLGRVRRVRGAPSQITVLAEDGGEIV